MFLNGIFVQEGSSESRFDHGQFEIKTFSIYARPSDYHIQILIWWNRKVRLKTKRFPFIKICMNMVYICMLNDLDRGCNFVKIFDMSLFWNLISLLQDICFCECGII